MINDIEKTIEDIWNSWINSNKINMYEKKRKNKAAEVIIVFSFNN